MRGGDLLVKCLEAEGVTRIFGIPGEENLDVMDALIDSKIKFVLTKHENSAAFMANACARLTGKPQVCLSTLGPGATNMMTGVADAYLSYYPLVALTGQAGAERAYHPQKQYIDLVQMFRPVTKESFSVRTTSRIPVQVRRAFDIAVAERPGPVHLELPEDVMKEQAKGEPIKKGHIHHLRTELAAIESVREVMANSRKPLVFAGAGVIRANAVSRLQRLVHRWHIPVVHTWHGAGMVSYEDEESLNTVGLRSSDFVRSAFEEADAVILVGFDLPEFAPTFWNVGVRKTIVHIDSLPAESVPNYAPDVQLVGDIGSILDRLSVDAKPRRFWAAQFREDLNKSMEKCRVSDTPVKPQLIVRTIRRSLGKEDICVSDVGAHLIWLAKYYPVYKENTLLLTNGLIPMGVGVPTAIAAKLTHPSKKVVAVVGDAGLMMSVTELETAKRLGVRFVTVVFNDRDLGLIKTKHENVYGRAYDTRFDNPDLVELANSFGAVGYRVETASELKEALRLALEEDELAIIDVPVDYSENKHLL
ncbi:MAG TPA: acetolactate synthase large subunit [Methanomassiliicoccales archaeon]|nr:acetolactate synthase large subunit [Methanomassiliicoccales archaeon]